MSVLFETTEINGMKLPNRFVRSATWEGMATEDGAVTTKLLDLMRQLSDGCLGLVVTSHCYVQREGQAGPGQLGVYKDDLIEGLGEIPRTCRNRGVPVVMQITHGGYFANADLTGSTPMAPSRNEGVSESPRRVMTVEDIQETVKAFGDAARRGKKAGFHGVQIHAAHGYLMNQFLSPAFNRRTDAYGGPLRNRARFLLEVLSCVRENVGGDFPVLVKLNSQDFLENELSLDDSLEVGVLLQEGGIDAIEVSGGTVASGKLNPVRSGIRSEEKEAYFRDAAKAFKDALQVPIMLVGGIRTFHLAERLVQEGFADYISMSRPLIREPDLVKRWAAGDYRRAECISDNRCFAPGMEGKGIYCVTEKRQKKGRPQR